MSTTHNLHRILIELDEWIRAAETSPASITPQHAGRLGELLDCAGYRLAQLSAAANPETADVRARHRETLLRLREALLRLHASLRGRHTQLCAASSQAAAASRWSARLRETY